MTLSVTNVMESRIIILLVNTEIKTMYKEGVVTNWIYPGYLRWDTEDTSRNFSHVCCSIDEIWNQNLLNT